MLVLEIIAWAAFGALLGLVQRYLFSTVPREFRFQIGGIAAIFGGFVTRVAMPWLDPVRTLLAAGLVAMVALVIVEFVGRSGAPLPR